MAKTKFYMDDEPGPWVRCVIESDRPGYSNGLPSFIIRAQAKPTGQFFMHPTQKRLVELYEHFVYRTVFPGLTSL